MTCLICGSSISEYCSTKVLGKYDVQYFQCNKCKFISTESPYWLNEAYSSAITKLDIGLVTRNELMVPIVKAIIQKWFNPGGRFIDYGGGYGMLVRMMRDRGYDYYRQDMYCTNLYAESFDLQDMPPFRGDLLTAFEVFEHLTDPQVELKKMLELSDTIVFSTNVQPNDHVTPESWWYFTPETGQHISLYSRASLQTLADQFNLNYCWNDQNIHLFSRKKIDDRVFKLVTHLRWNPWYNRFITKRESLLPKDFSVIQEKLRKSL